jgi:hypothetical protein
MNAILLEPYRSNEKQKITKAVNAIMVELTESPINETGFSDNKLARK